MSGIEKIKGEIISEAKLTAKNIAAEADAKAKEIIKTAEHEAEILSNQILKDADVKAESIKTSAESACALDRKNKILEAKMELINSSFDVAKEKLCSLDDKTYFAVLKKLILFYAVKGKGELILSQKDKKRIPENFISAVSKDLTADKELVLSESTDNSLLGGCIIKYDEIEINCDFDAIISGERERLIDSVNNVLFN